jgi:hypothetical protein
MEHQHCGETAWHGEVLKHAPLRCIDFEESHRRKEARKMMKQRLELVRKVISLKTDLMDLANA